MIWAGYFFTHPGFRLPHPGVKRAPDPGSRIRNTVISHACLAAGFPQEQVKTAAGWVVGATAVVPTANPRHLFFMLLTTEYIEIEMRKIG
jgi:hypothetical protein